MDHWIARAFPGHHTRPLCNAMCCLTALQLYMALFSVALLVPATMIMEPAAWGAMVAAMQAPGSTFGTWLLVNCFLAYAQNLLNFWVTKFTSALSLQASALLACILILHMECTRQCAYGMAEALAVGRPCCNTYTITTAPYSELECKVPYSGEPP